jgi:hypothetical protein
MSEPTSASVHRDAEPPLPDELPCPLCGGTLRRDPLWPSPHWICPNAHSYSNVHVLLAELAERGWRPSGGQAGDGADGSSTSPDRNE